MRSFMAFLGLQLLRTKKIKDVFLKNQPRETDLEKFIANATPNIWWFMSYVFGAELGKNLYLDRRNDTHTLLINDTDISFITSDQPVINIHESASNSGINPPEHLDLYYPITPRIAYLISETARFQSGKVNVTAETVNELNIEMAKKSNTDIFGNSRLVLSNHIHYLQKDW